MASSRAFLIFVHLVGWALFFSLIVAASAINKQVRFADVLSPPFLLFYTTFLFLFYLNKNVLLPRLYLRKKYALYTVVIICLFAGVAVLQPFDKIVKGQRERFEPMPRTTYPQRRNLPPQGRPRRGPVQWDIVSIFLFITVCTGSLALALFQQWRQTERRAAQAEIDKAKAELSFLKAQVNPHFLFNTLNNIYALTVEKNAAAPDAVLKLSNIMRYVTDEAHHDLVPLADELACVADYIALQQLRLNQKTTVSVAILGEVGTQEIAPLLLMPFVENVFKYGISNHLPSTMNIVITVGKDSVQLFTKNRVIQQAAHTSTGIGISNTSQRLRHLYPNRHTLVLTNDGEQFTVQLSIKL